MVRYFAVIMLFAGLIGSRLFYVISHYENFSGRLLEALYFWRGGLMFQGGLLTALVLSFLLTRLWKVPFYQMADAMAPALTIGQGVGRIGCFMEGCCYGRGAPEGFPLGVVFPIGGGAPPGRALYPTQAAESVGLLILTFILFWLLTRDKRPCGQVFGAYLVGAGFLRLAVELFRGDDRGPLFMGFPFTTWAAIVLALWGLWILFSVYLKAKKGRVPQN
jgi:phosphatidylglycerol:prolipoprotein diacylglycerol transferase